MRDQVSESEKCLVSSSHLAQPPAEARQESEFLARHPVQIW